MILIDLSETLFQLKNPQNPKKRSRGKKRNQLILIETYLWTDLFLNTDFLPAYMRAF